MNPSENQNEVVVAKESIIAPLCKVTSLSKYLAVVVFIVMPFVGGFIGYSLGMQHALETTVQRSVVIDRPNTKHPLNSEAQNNNDQVEATAEGVAADQTTLMPNWMVYQPAAESKTLLYEEYVMPKDKQAETALNSPYLTLLYKNESMMVLTVGCFKYSECGNSGLYKLDMVDKTLSTMKTSPYYSPMMTGASWSQDGEKVAVVSAHTLGIIDVVNDTYTIAKTFDLSEKKEFRICEMGCSSKIVWNSAQSITAEVYTYEVCNEIGYDCGSTVTDANGDSYLSSAPLSTSEIEIRI